MKRTVIAVAPDVPLVGGIVNIGKSLLVVMSVVSLAGQPPPPARGPAPPPPGPGGPPPAGGWRGVRQRLTDAKPAGEVPRKMLALARTYLERAKVRKSALPFPE